MRIMQSVAAVIVIALAACGQPAATSTAEAQPASAATAPAPAAAPATAAEKAAILRAMHMTANARGLVMNECNDLVQPQFVPADVGLGRTILFVMTGGPNGGFTCYGDGPGLWLMRADGVAFREVYTSRGGYMAIMPAKHSGANDLVFAGPGFSHPSSRWNGSAYVAGPEVSDEALANAQTLPQ